VQLDHIEFSEAGIILYGKDGTFVQFSVQDAMELSRWLGQNCVKLYKLYGKQYEQEQQQKKAEQKA